MASHVICGCGIPYRLRGLKAGSRPRCPVCGRGLKVPALGADEPAPGSPLAARLKVGAGVASAVGLVALAIATLWPGKERTSTVSAASPVATPIATASAAPVATRTESATVGALDHQMLPTGPIGGGSGR